MEEFTLKYFNQTKVFNHEVKLIDLLPDQDKKKYFCAKVNNHLHELNYTVFYDADIEFIDISDEEGMYVYEATLRYLLAMALYELNKDIDLKISYYESRSLFGIILNENIIVDDKFIVALNNKMREIVKNDYPLNKKNCTE